MLWTEAKEWPHLYLAKRPAIWLLLVVGLGVMGAKQYNYFKSINPRDPATWNNTAGAITGVVNQQPDPRMSGCVYVLTAESWEPFDLWPERHALQGQVMLHVLGSTVPAADPGDRIRASGRLKSPRGSTVPGTFDFESYLEIKDIHSLMYTGSTRLQNLGPTGSNKSTKLGWTIKQMFLKSFTKHLPPQEAAVISGLMIGNRPRFHPDVKQLFLESGTMHVLVASGSNVAFVILMWYVFARLVFRLPRRWALASALPFVWMYVLIVGSDPPILRAGVMGSVGIVGYLLNRMDRPYQALALAAWVLLLINPQTLFDCGFQMSFLTVFGLIYYLTPLENAIGETPALLKWFIRIFSSTMIAQIWIMPVIASVFRRFYPVGFLANLTVIPFAAAGLPAGLLVYIFDWLNWTGPIVLIKWYLSLFLKMVAFFVEHGGPCVWVLEPNKLMVVGNYVFLLSIVGVRNRIWPRLFSVLGIFLFAWGWANLNHSFSPPNGLRITWVDIGKNVSTLIETPGGKRVLINPGPLTPANTSERTIMPFLLSRGIRKLDYVVITHPDLQKNASAKQLSQWTKAIQIDISTTANETRIEDITLLPIEPPNNHFERTTLVTMGNQRMLLTRGLSIRTQKKLLEMKISRLEILQARFSPNMKWKEEFLERLKPKITVEVGFSSEARPSAPPWNDTTHLSPQQTGWAVWNGPVENSKAGVSTPRQFGADNVSRSAQSF